MAENVFEIFRKTFLEGYNNDESAGVVVALAKRDGKKDPGVTMANMILYMAMCQYIKAEKIVDSLAKTLDGIYNQFFLPIKDDEGKRNEAIENIKSDILFVLVEMPLAKHFRGEIKEILEKFGTDMPVFKTIQNIVNKNQIEDNSDTKNNVQSSQQGSSTRSLPAPNSSKVIDAEQAEAQQVDNSLFAKSKFNEHKPNLLPLKIFAVYPEGRSWATNFNNLPAAERYLANDLKGKGKIVEKPG